ncbi:SOS response-associated peptidase family protein [Reyranella massiliensis]|uniref:SOS response-associated peptidase family protein n=1 Tax=Reyranella massiliensis TaxID=445220 RepID=UPI0002EF4BC4|nr:SOS response-associated peptidase family protein [Reyranella massiliensis]
MCGKFTAQATWREVVDFSQALTGDGGEAGGDAAGADDVYTYKVNGMLPVIIWDAEAGKRRVVPMRWGFPDPKDWRRPRPIHARSETIDRIQPFRKPFHDRQTGIVVFQTFNEAQEVLNSKNKPVTKQWTVDPKDGQPRGFAFLWQRFEIADLPVPMLACVMVTVPANELIGTTIKAAEDDPRMPAILGDSYDEWATWLGESDADPATAKALLKTVEGVTWEAFPEPPKPRKR